MSTAVSDGLRSPQGQTSVEKPGGPSLMELGPLPTPRTVSVHNGEGDYGENNCRSLALQGKGCQAPVFRGICDRDLGGQAGAPVLCFTRPRSRSRTWTSVPPRRRLPRHWTLSWAFRFSKRDPVKSLRKAYAGTQVAVVALPDDLAATALKLGHVRIGWVNCRIRAREEAARCYRCWSPGHVAARCKGPDRTELCYRCGQKGHQAKDCKGQPSSPRTADDENPPAQPQSLRGCPGPALRHHQQAAHRRGHLVRAIQEPCSTQHMARRCRRPSSYLGAWRNSVQERPARVHPYFAWARIGGIFFFSVYYAPPRLSEREFSALLANITEEARGRRPLVIAGDFNAWSTEWGCRETRPRASHPARLARSPRCGAA
ncbi:unnamed protein product [Trichogramma brassicae]|uniref:CCHC-type domain-containing protein n=1 Tax=Trichogramma brassicae TaxID=86971 RepID=A0A6H5ILQ1_9HYME|nr:unnamed protein product [Trichogramma brassicae]